MSGGQEGKSSHHLQQGWGVGGCGGVGREQKPTHRQKPSRGCERPVHSFSVLQPLDLPSTSLGDVPGEGLGREPGESSSPRHPAGQGRARGWTCTPTRWPAHSDGLPCLALSSPRMHPKFIPSCRSVVLLVCLNTFISALILRRLRFLGCFYWPEVPLSAPRCRAHLPAQFHSRPSLHTLSLALFGAAALSSWLVSPSSGSPSSQDITVPS